MAVSLIQVYDEISTRVMDLSKNTNKDVSSDVKGSCM